MLWALWSVGYILILDAAFCTVQDELLFGCSDYHQQYDYVCCDNSQMAEHAGFLNTVGLWSQVDQEGVTTFYDSSCNLPVFKAPVGRTFEEWQAESNAHGWPSFRDAEVVWENVQVVNNEIKSTCKTHLGHNIPDSENRYCIDLFCISGKPPKSSAGSYCGSDADCSSGFHCYGYTNKCIDSTLLGATAPTSCFSSDDCDTGYHCYQYTNTCIWSALLGSTASNDGQVLLGGTETITCEKDADCNDDSQQCYVHTNTCIAVELLGGTQPNTCTEDGQCPEGFSCYDHTQTCIVTSTLGGIAPETTSDADEAATGTVDTSDNDDDSLSTSHIDTIWLIIGVLLGIVLIIVGVVTYTRFKIAKEVETINNVDVDVKYRDLDSYLVQEAEVDAI